MRVSTVPLDGSAPETAAPVATAVPLPAPVPAETPAPDPVASVPAWSDASPDARAVAGGLRLDVHVYAEQADRRFVLINMKKYREGDRLAEGPSLEFITPTGIVLAHRGERFRMDRD